jgi:predicted transcriptional regulator
MTVKEIADILQAEIVCGEERAQTTVINSAFSSDMMSDVLAFVNDQGALLTGLVNPQVVRTAEMMDISCIIFVRGKRPDSAMIALAEARGIILLSTPERMYPACGKLYMAGLSEGTTR